MDEKILEVQNLNIWLKDGQTQYSAVNNFSVSVKKGKTLGIIGESGSGKSISCMAVMGLLDHDKWSYSGTVVLNGKELAFADDKKMCDVRGNSIAMIMQNPGAAFDPVYTIRRHFEETMRAHSSDLTKKEIKERAVDMLGQMHIKNPESVYNSYPFQCSGGILQRIMIAIAIAQNPAVLIADEPTTALDLTTQHEIIKILKEMQQRYGTSIIMVSHDLGVITHMADDIAVMYSGNIVESGNANDVISAPMHQYTKGLFSSRPAFSKERLPELSGTQISLKERGTVCQFYERCGLKCKACLEYDMSDVEISGRKLKCCRLEEQ